MSCHPEEATDGTRLDEDVEDGTPSEDVSFDDGDGCIIGLIVGVLSLCNTSAVFIKTLFVVLCNPGDNEPCLLCNKWTIFSTVRRKCASRYACGIGMMCGIMVGVSFICSLCNLGV